MAFGVADFEESLVIDEVSAGIGDGESEGFFGLRRTDSLVDHVDFLRITSADLIEDVEEVGVVGLAVDGFEFDNIDAEVFGDFAIEEERAVKMVGEEFAFGRVADDWFELPDIAKCDEGNAAEGVRGFPVALEGNVYGVQEIGANHGDFVKEDELEGVDEAAFRGSGTEGGDVASFGIHGAGSEGEEAMDCLSAGIESGDAGGGEGDAFEGEGFAEVSQEGGFSSSGAAGHEDEASAEGGFFDLFDGSELFFGELDIRREDWG